MIIPVRPPTKETSDSRMTIAYLLLDASGSMNQGKTETMQAFNAYFAGLKSAENFQFAVSQFNSIHGVTVISESTTPAKVRKLTNASYTPNGGTPLYDAIAFTIQQAEDAWDGESGVLIVIQTDGEENSSQQWRQAQVKELIEAKTELGWQFVYLGKGIDAMDAGKRIGMAVGNTISYDFATTRKAAQVMTMATLGYAACGSVASDSFSGSDSGLDLTKSDTD